MARLIAEHGGLGEAVLSHLKGDLDEARGALEDRYLGRYWSLADYMEGVIEGSISKRCSKTLYTACGGYSHGMS